MIININLREDSTPELLGLSWEDISGDYLSVNRAVYLEHNRPTVREFQAKTAASIRKVPLMPTLRERIESLPDNGRYIFGTCNGTLMHPRNFNRDYDKFFDKLQEASPEVRHLSPHCCRHTCATLTLSGGADVRVVQTLLGHSNIQTTARYTHPDQAALHSAVQGMAAMLGQDNK